MEFVDRVSAYPNRYTMTDENGNVSYVILERADEPITPGTPLNAETLNELTSVIEKMKSLLGVEIQTSIDGHVDYHIEILDFDYFRVYQFENDPCPIVCQVISKDFGSLEVYAVRWDGVYNIAVGNAQPGWELSFTWNEQDECYMAEFNEISQDGTSHQAEFARLVGYKYPPVQE